MIKSINITKQNYLDYSNFAIKRTCRTKEKKDSGFLKSMILWCIIGIVFMTIFQITSRYSSSFHWPSSVITSMPFVLFILVFYFNSKSLKKLVIPNENGLTLGEKTIEFQAEGINETSSFGHCFYKWEVVEALEENKGDIYIFVDKLLALIIPAESFSTPTEKEELKLLVKKYV